jgi:Amidohydrolase
MAGLRRDHRGRFGHFAVLPLPDLDASLGELERAYGELAVDGIGLLTSYDDRWLGDPSFAPLFAELDRRGAVVYVHPTVAPCCANLQPELQPAFLEFPFDTTRTIASLLLSGRLSRYPHIRFIFSHGGGALPAVYSRLSAAALRPDVAERLPQGPLPELRKLYYDVASVTDRPSFTALADLIPFSQLLLGTDFPLCRAWQSRSRRSRPSSSHLNPRCACCATTPGRCSRAWMQDRDGTDLNAVAIAINAASGLRSDLYRGAQCVPSVQTICPVLPRHLVSAAVLDAGPGGAMNRYRTWVAISHPRIRLSRRSASSRSNVPQAKLYGVHLDLDYLLTDADRFGLKAQDADLTYQSPHDHWTVTAYVPTSAMRTCGRMRSRIRRGSRSSRSMRCVRRGPTAHG